MNKVEYIKNNLKPKTHNLYKYVIDVSDFSSPGDHITNWLEPIVELGYRYFLFNDILYEIINKDYKSLHLVFPMAGNINEDLEDDMLKYIISESRKKKLERITK